jgi:hypothetical protein
VFEGGESKFKDMLLSLFLMHFLLEKKKTIKVYHGADDKLDAAYASAFFSVDFLSGYKANNAAAFMKEQLTNDRVVMISVSKLKVLEEVFGPTFVDYISHEMVKVDCTVARSKIIPSI